MKWIEFAVYTTDMGIELVCGALTGVSIDQVAIEESAAAIETNLRQTAAYWDFADAAALAGGAGPCVKAYIADVPAQRALLRRARAAVKRLEEFYPLEEIAPLHIVETVVDDEDWANNWKRFYKPIVIGERLLVCPAWEKDALPAGALAGRELILMDPGMTFGTGAHHTTRLCMELLEQSVSLGGSVLDLGCGSGILSIAALRLGAKLAVCVDIDPVAKRAVENNLRTNGMQGADVRVYTGDILTNARLRENIAGAYELIMANIVADVIIPLCAFAGGWLAVGGAYICSGIIEERENDVLTALRAAGFDEIRKLSSPDTGENETAWLAFLARKGR
ncbi:MAG: 50S ribosomal protein L11 methyltransferase [Clostridiales bacterium]|jgi:ribosomal protein L11 methyltransferase|nr:50S ribosomal protein L11 methyltransferase [Clostridiales bacterium]